MTHTAGGRSPCSYLAKSLDALSGLASSSPSVVRSAAGALRSDTRETTAADAENGREWWRLALYWTAEMTIATVSPCLNPDTDADDGLPYVSRYEYVGTARLGEFPVPRAGAGGSADALAAWWPSSG